MANSLLTPQVITKESLRILHDNLGFVKQINRQYDDSYAQAGARIGDSLKIRLPNQFTVRSGATISVQDVSEASVTLQLATQKGVDFTFSSSELALTIDQFSARYLRPAVARLASEIESDALSMIKDVYNFVDDDATAVSFLGYMKAKQKLDEFLAPDDQERVALAPPTHVTKFADATKALFVPTKNLDRQGIRGLLGNWAGFDFSTHTMLTAQATGTSAKVTGYTVNETTAGDDGTVTVAAGANTFKKGDVLTLAGCNAVHPETKADLGYLKQFVVTADYAGGAGSVSISPTTVLTGAKQNITAFATNGGNVVKVGAGASETYVQSLLFHPDAFTIAFADLPDVSQYGAWGAREVMDNISMRIGRQWDITNDRIPCRMDVFYGYKTIRPELAVRYHADG